LEDAPCAVFDKEALDSRRDQPGAKKFCSFFIYERTDDGRSTDGKKIPVDKMFVRPSSVRRSCVRRPSVCPSIEIESEGEATDH